MLVMSMELTYVVWSETCTVCCDVCWRLYWLMRWEIILAYVPRDHIGPLAERLYCLCAGRSYWPFGQEITLAYVLGDISDIYEKREHFHAFTYALCL